MRVRGRLLIFAWPSHDASAFGRWKADPSTLEPKKRKPPTPTGADPKKPQGMVGRPHWRRQGKHSPIHDPASAKNGRSRGHHMAKNDLRHNFGTYRLAQTQNVHRVSDEMGNSPARVREHYRQLVTKSEAKKWWNIMPVRIGKTSKVVEGALKALPPSNAQTPD
jgi:hypothetical protein